MIWFYLKSLRENLLSIKSGSALLSSFGALWLIVKIADYFFQGSSFAQAIPSYWWLFFSIGIISAIVICLPKVKKTAKLNGRDVQIEIAVGDLFDFSGTLIISSNTTFDTQLSRQLISERSIQGQFTTRFYGGDTTQLDAEIRNALNEHSFEELIGPRVGKSKRYKVGTVVKVSPRDRSAYFIALANLNQHGVAYGDFESVKVALTNLWSFIAERGLKEHIIIPVIGSGFMRLTDSREEIVREIIKSFIAACAERVFADKLTIVIHPHDLKENNISFEKLSLFLTHICNYTEYREKTKIQLGTLEG